MSEIKNRRDFLVKTAAVVAASSSVVACGGGDTAPALPVLPAQFSYGVASGDPLSDRVMLWTHTKVADSNADVPLT